MPQGASCCEGNPVTSTATSGGPPKGCPEGGEAPEETALRKTCGETGVVAEIIGRVPLD